MKLRNGFVSNSSSSSFIVSAAKGVEPSLVIKAELPYDEKISTVKQLDRYYLNYYAGGEGTLEELFKDDPDIREDYEACVEEIESGRVLFIGSISNEDSNEVSVLLYEQGGVEGSVHNGKVIKNY